jgi:CheY-like chemotaxis protein
MRSGKSTSPAEPVRVLLVDNDMGQIIAYAGALQDRGFLVKVAETPAECMEAVARERFAAVVMDLVMPHGSELPALECRGGMLTGLVLGKWLRANHPAIQLACLSFHVDPDATEWFDRFGWGASTKHEVTPAGLGRLVARMAGLREGDDAFRAFIVHGSAVAERTELARWLISTRRCARPVVLQNEPEAGLTIIEKFEAHAGDVDVVFVLVTPDDLARRADASRQAHRPRQNVVFELGYFCGRLRRRSGKVLILTKGVLELPSDIVGMATIDISNGLRPAYPRIRRELARLKLERKGRA